MNNTPPHRSASQLAPISREERIVSLDVLRGIAILGIFFVNIAFFSGSMAMMMNPAILAEQPLSERIAWAFVKIFAEFKFISLFSLLFGIGLVVQLQRAQQRGQALGGTYIRRLLVLMCIGLLHGLLIWYGDILFMYAVGGFVLFLLRNISARTMAILATCAFALGGLFYTGASALTVVGERFSELERETANTTGETRVGDVDGEVVVPDVASVEADDRWDRWTAALEQWTQADFNVLDESFHEVETIAYKEGPMLATVLTRAITFAGHVFFAGVFSGFALRIIALFLIGAAMMKWGFFDSQHRRLHAHLAVFGLALGLILEASVVGLYQLAEYQPSPITVLADAVHWFASALLMFGYVGAVCTIVHAGVLRLLQTAIAAVGRMALTNYLLQSLVATFVMYWWGLGLFGEFSRVQQLLLVVGVFAGQIAFSLIWLSAFRFGPMEWLWRTLAYCKLQPMMLRNGTT